MNEKNENTRPTQATNQGGREKVIKNDSNVSTVDKINASLEIIPYEDDGSGSLGVLFAEDDVWLTQAQIVDLYQSSKQNISHHISNIFSDEELEKISSVKYFLTPTKNDRYTPVKHYNLDMIISIGYRVNSKAGVKFRQWATKRLKEHMYKSAAQPQVRDENWYKIRDENRMGHHEFSDAIHDILAPANPSKTERLIHQIENKFINKLVSGDHITGMRDYLSPYQLHAQNIIRGWSIFLIHNGVVDLKTIHATLADSTHKVFPHVTEDPLFPGLEKIKPAKKIKAPKEAKQLPEKIGKIEIAAPPGQTVLIEFVETVI